MGYKYLLEIYRGKIRVYDEVFDSHADCVGLIERRMADLRECGFNIDDRMLDSDSGEVIADHPSLDGVPVRYVWRPTGSYVHDTPDRYEDYF